MHYDCLPYMFLFFLGKHNIKKSSSWWSGHTDLAKSQLKLTHYCATSLCCLCCLCSAMESAGIFSVQLPSQCHNKKNSTLFPRENISPNSRVNHIPHKMFGAHWSEDFRESSHKRPCRTVWRTSFFNLFFSGSKQETKVLPEGCPNPISITFWHAPAATDRCPEETDPNIFALNLPLCIASSAFFFFFLIQVCFFCQRHRGKEGVLYKNLHLFYTREILCILKSMSKSDWWL